MAKTKDFWRRLQIFGEDYEFFGEDYGFLYLRQCLLCINLINKYIIFFAFSCRLFTALITVVVAPILTAVLVELFVTNVIDPEEFR